MPIKKNHMQSSNTFKCIAMLYRIYTILLRPKNIDSSLREDGTFKDAWFILKLFAA